MSVQTLQHRKSLTFYLVLLLILLATGLFVNVKAQAQMAYNEAPQLAQRVAAGELPPVEERLPENPMIIEPVERIGEYGGTWRSALVGGGDLPWLMRTLGLENLVRWNIEWTQVIPNIAESFEVNEDATEFTFYLRRGMKWSDGHPFTADDIMFWYEDVFMNEELTLARPGWLMVGDDPVVVTKLDDYTVVFSFTSPYGLFLQQLPNGNMAAPGSLPNMYPRHYLEQFHPRYNPDGIGELIQQEGFDSWVNLFEAKSNTWTNSSKPTLHGWVLTVAFGESTTRVIAERNPYYWKVDTEGNQLPYIDRISYELLGDAEVYLLKALGGEIDMNTDRHIGTTSNRAVLFDHQERGDYRFFEVVQTASTDMVIALNMTHQDPVRREIFQNKDFRIGLSHAINRQEVIDLVYVGQGEPYQPAPRPESEFYHEQLAKQYTDYDIDLANEYLDRAGYTERDAEGFRLGPDGTRISFSVSVIPARQDWIDVLEVVRGYWRTVGIDMQIRVLDRSLFTVNVQANQHDAVAWFGGPGLRDLLLDMRWIFPQTWDSSFAVAWADWYVGGPQAEEPPEVVKRQQALYDQLSATVDEVEQRELVRQILDIAAEQFYVMGIRLQPSAYGIVRNNFRNVPESMFDSGGPYNAPAQTNPVQYFIESSGR